MSNNMTLTVGSKQWRDFLHEKLGMPYNFMNYLVIGFHFKFEEADNNNDIEFFNHFGLRFEIRSPTENLKMCYLDILKRRIRTMIIFQNSEFLALSYLRQGFNSLVMYPTYNWR